MNIKNKKLFFFFPYRGVGGVPILFLRIAHYLSNLNKYDLYLIDYKDGYMAKNYNKDKNIKLLLYNPNENITFNSTDIILFQSMSFFLMPKNLRYNADAKIIFWNLHPYNLFGYAARISRFKNKIVQSIFHMLFRTLIYSKDRKVVDLLQKNKSLFFMDGENLEQTEKLLKINIENPIYLPLMIDGGENIKFGYVQDSENLNCVWIGRIADFKVHVLAYTVKQIEKYCISKNINCSFTIVGDGDFLQYLQGELVNLSIKVIYVNHINSSDVKDFLKGIDVAFGMGSSALDTAKYGVPTVLLDFTYEKILKDYRFNWLFNTENYTLGRNITHKSYQEGNNTLEVMMDELFSNYSELANSSFEYIFRNFDVQHNIKKFISLVDTSGLVAKQIPKQSFKMNIFQKMIGAKRYYNE